MLLDPFREEATMMKQFDVHSRGAKVARGVLAFAIGFGFVLLATGVSPCWGQDAASPKLALFAGAGADFSSGHSRGATQFGASFEEAPPNAYFGMLFEVGYVGPWSSFKSGSAIFSANYVSSWSTDKKERFLPFATVGYSRLFGTGNAINFGGGLDYRLSHHHAIRFEVRDYDSLTGPRGHDLGIRVGWVIYIPD
jgi:hypothetical protein